MWLASASATYWVTSFRTRIATDRFKPLSLIALNRLSRSSLIARPTGLEFWLLNAEHSFGCFCMFHRIRTGTVNGRRVVGIYTRVNLRYLSDSAHILCPPLVSIQNLVCPSIIKYIVLVERSRMMANPVSFASEMVSSVVYIQPLLVLWVPGFLKWR